MKTALEAARLMVKEQNRSQLVHLQTNFAQLIKQLPQLLQEIEGNLQEYDFEVSKYLYDYFRTNIPQDYKLDEEYRENLEKFKKGIASLAYQEAKKITEERWASFDDQKPTIFNLYYQSALLGNADAQYELGKIYLENEQFDDAKTCFIEAYNASHVEAGYELGKIFIQRGADINLGIRFLEEAYNKGSIDAAKELLSHYYYKGRLTESAEIGEQLQNLKPPTPEMAKMMIRVYKELRNENKVIEWQCRAANLGVPDCAYQAALGYHNIYSCSKEKTYLQEAAKWFNVDLDQSDDYRSLTIFLLSIMKLGDVEKLDSVWQNHEERRALSYDNFVRCLKYFNYADGEKDLIIKELYENADFKNDEERAAFNLALGEVLTIWQAKNKDDRDAEMMMVRYQGHSDDQTNFSLFNEEAKRHEKRGLVYLESKAFLEKDGRASYSLGEIYDAENNHEKALEYYRRAAFHNNIDACCRVAEYYKEGKGIPLMDENSRMQLSRNFYEKAAGLLVKSDGPEAEEIRKQMVNDWLSPAQNMQVVEAKSAVHSGRYQLLQ